MLVFDFACAGRSRGAQECSNHFPPDQIRVSMLAGEFRHNRPNLMIRYFKSLAQAWIVAPRTGGLSMSVIIAASRP